MDIFIVVLTAIYKDDTIISSVYFTTEQKAKDYINVMLERHNDQPYHAGVMKIRLYSA
jgi:hypothetical protein